MPSNQRPFQANAILREKRSRRFSWGLALVSAIAVGFHIFILSGWIDWHQAGNGEFVYFISAIVYFPILLSYIEFAQRSIKSDDSGFITILKKKKSSGLLFLGNLDIIFGFHFLNFTFW
jgi:hypothetical protein